MESSKELNFEEIEIKNLLLDMIIGSAELAKQSSDSPATLQKEGDFTWRGNRKSIRGI